MPAKSKRAKKIRKAQEFDLSRIASMLRPPKGASFGAHIWTLEEIVAARDAQMLGSFSRPARLAAAMRTDDALFVAYQNRLAPQRGLPVDLVPPNDSARALRVLEEAKALFGTDGVGIAPETLATINGDLANHGVAFAVNAITPREDGSRIDLEVHHWPIDFVRWDASSNTFVTQIDTESGSDLDRYGSRFEVPICHGDGRWIVFRKHETNPWQHEACVLPGLLWAVHAYAWRDWARGANAHGSPKVHGQLPESMPIDSEEGAAFLEMLRVFSSDDYPYGLSPHGAKVELLTNTSGAWQIFQELANDSGKAAARIYLGQDGTIGSNPSAPGIDAGFLFGVRNDIVEGDLRAIERGILEGALVPWTAMNFGDSTLAPKRVYLMPDADEEARRRSMGERTTTLLANVKAAREAGLIVDQAWIDVLAKDLGIPSPRVAAAPTAPPAPAGETGRSGAAPGAATVSPLRRAP